MFRTGACTAPSAESLVAVRLRKRRKVAEPAKMFVRTAPGPAGDPARPKCDEVRASRRPQCPLRQHGWRSFCCREPAYLRCLIYVIFEDMKVWSGSRSRTFISRKAFGMSVTSGSNVHLVETEAGGAQQFAAWPSISSNCGALDQIELFHDAPGTRRMVAAGIGQGQLAVLTATGSSSRVGPRAR